ncbi:MAG: haloperoxidase [Thalassobius sp.]|nr:haloperoxidase [Thalassovita sp.]
MNKRILTILLLVALFTACNNHNTNDSEKIAAINVNDSTKTGVNNLAYKWGKVVLEATARDTERFKPRPTISSRMLGMVFISIFDAWAHYDEKAIPVYSAEIEKRPVTEHTLENKEIAISYAAYRALNEYFYSDSVLFADFMVDLGLDPKNNSLDPTTPAGIGNLAAKNVIEKRKNDGSNQYGDVPGSNGKPYSDYTNYKPVNTPEKNVDLKRWQPKYFADGKGGFFAPPCLTPYWQKVETFGLKSSDQFRPAAPPAIGSEQLKKEVQEVVDLQANLSDEDKALVEFMRDGPKSVQQAGHWLILSQVVSERDQHTLDEDVKMYFYNQTTAMDAFIACWDSKMYYDFARPYALVHDQFAGQEITGWAGPEKGMVSLKGEQWRPYSPDVFLCPPFPGYVSGHSSISGACAEALKLFTGSDEFGFEVKLVAGILTEPDHVGDTVTLKFPTFTETGEMAGISRVMGGYHIQADNIEGLVLGRNVAHEVWKKYKYHIGESEKDI